MKKRCLKTSFTLLELIVTIVLIGVIATVAIPNFGKTVVQEKARKAMMDLYTMHSAQVIYKAKNGQNWLPADGTPTFLADANAALGLNIVADGLDYAGHVRVTGDPDSYQFLVGSPTFLLKLTDEPLGKDTTSTGADNPCCAGDGCPTPVPTCF